MLTATGNQFMQTSLARCEPAGTSSVPLLGMFADAPGLIDEIVDAAMKERAEQPLRRSPA